MENDKKNKYCYQKKYHDKMNSVAKSYRINADLEKRFRETCKMQGESQASVIQRFMEKYCKENAAEEKQ